MQPAPVPCQASRFCCFCCPRRRCCRRHRPRLLTIQRSFEPGQIAHHADSVQFRCCYRSP
ncbi:MAG: hypothetical protein EOO27_03715 [Comamonadaceae bacterium]|nr:MAG: hypothetical protein EOO27_03715 [Comamonadaceae bacterium]